MAKNKPQAVSQQKIQSTRDVWAIYPTQALLLIASYGDVGQNKKKRKRGGSRKQGETRGHRRERMRLEKDSSYPKSTKS